MRHANVVNLSTFFVKRLYAKGSLTITDCVKAMELKGETVHASEGEYEDTYMLEMIVQQVVDFLCMENPVKHGYSGPAGGGPWIIPKKPLTARQQEVLDQYSSDETEEWEDNVEDPNNGYEVFYNISWVFAPGKRKAYPDGIPILTNITN